MTQQSDAEIERRRSGFRHPASEQADDWTFKVIEPSAFKASACGSAFTSTLGRRRRKQRRIRVHRCARDARTARVLSRCRRCAMGSRSGQRLYAEAERRGIAIPAKD